MYVACGFSIVCFVILLLMLTIPVARSGIASMILISEVQTNPLGSDTGLEYVELINISSEMKDISGWDLDAADLPYYTFPTGTMILPHEMLRVILRADGLPTTHDLYTGATFGSTNMKNTSGAVALFSSSTHNDQTLVDYMEYGAANQTHEGYALVKALWSVGTYVNISTDEDISFQRICIESGSTCWTLQKSTPGSHIIVNVPTQNTNSNVTIDTFSGSILNSELFINDQKELGQVLTMNVPVKITILPSSGALLSVWKDNQSVLVDAGRYEESFDVSGTYILSYQAHNANKQEIMKTMELTVTLPSIPPLFIQEVAFNEAKPRHNFIELGLSGANPDISYDLSKFTIEIDQTKIPLVNTALHPGERYVVSFGGGTPSSLESIQMSPSSLVGTTEQITLLYDGKIQDGVCWEDLPIAATEQNDDQNFHEPIGKWSGACINSREVHEGESIIRKGQGMPLALNQWTTYPVSTKGTENTVVHSNPTARIDIQGNGSSTGVAPFHLNLTGEQSTDMYGISSYLWNYGDGFSSTEVNPLDHVYSQAGTYTISLKVINVFGDENEMNIPVVVSSPNTIVSQGITSTNSTSIQSCLDLSEQQVRISEILPNPTGVDTDQEWIELYNPLEQEVTFCGLSLDDEEGGSTPFSLAGKKIAAHGYLLVKSSESKILLSNSTGIVRLLIGNTTIESSTYLNAPEGKSYSRMDL